MTVFVIAMESEAEPLIVNMTGVTRSYVYDKNIYRGKLCGQEVCAVVCGVGKVNAAAGAQYAIDRLGADIIVNIGVAGGLNDGLQIGKIYGISHAVQYDFDLVQLNGTEIGTLNEFEENYLPLQTRNIYPLKRLATGDRFNDSEDDFRLLTNVLHADIRDMEGGAIAQVCIHAGVPFYSFKAISDLAGSGSTTEQFTRNLHACTVRLNNDIQKIFEAVNRYE
ncbi:MAG: 5'-methylthioadenosine/S-adenosylhomocysteine nucleosidase [Clostridiales bacterium]|nr:5'-methylthioadenosine/S-adenosylhomocysteine nucleosidase [Clostridiales bacterium]